MAETGRLSIRTVRGPGGLKRELLVDGHPFATTSRDVVKALELQDDDIISPGEVVESILAQEFTWARQRGLRLLNHRDRSRHELGRRLLEDGYSAATTDAVLERFQELGYLDDQRYADGLIRGKVASGWGRTRVRKALRVAGIDEPTAELALEREYPPDDLDRAREIAARHPVSDVRGAARLADRLIRRGFDPSIARTVAFEAIKVDPTSVDDSQE